MKMVTKLTAILLLAVFPLALTFAEGKQETKTGEPITLKVLYGGGANETHEVLEGSIGLFNETRDDVKVEMQFVAGQGFWDKFKVMMATKQLPDILRSDDDWVGEYFVRGQFMDLTELVKRDIDTKKFWTDSWKPFMFNGKVYGLPFKADVVALYYNKLIFNDNGVPMPGKNFMFKDYLEAAQKCTQEKGGRPDTFGTGIRTQWLYPQTWVWRFGGNLFNVEKTKSLLSSAKSKEGLQTYVDLRHKWKVAPSASTEMEEGSETLFRAGRLAMWEAGNWGLKAYREQRDAGTLDFGVSMPFKGPANSLTRATYEAWSMPSYAKNKEAAWDAMKHMSTDVRSQRLLASLSSIPVIKEIAYSEVFNNPATPEDETTFLKIIEESSRISEFLLQGAELHNKWEKNVEGLFLGTKTVDQATSAFAADIQQTIDSEKEFRPYANIDMATP